MNKNLNENEYKIYNRLLEYKEHFYSTISIILSNNQELELEFNLGKFSHLMGLHYCDKNNNYASVYAKNIIYNKLSDFEIYNDVIKSRKIPLKSFKDRVLTINFFLKNLEKARFVSMNNKNTTIKSVNFLLEINDNKYLQLGLAIDKCGTYYMETFLVRNNDNNIKYIPNCTIKDIYKKTSEKIIRFSFDTEKQAKLDEVAKIDKNYDYHEALNKSIEEIKQEKINI
ncbi:PBECR4 domain-containing protein [Sneathia vaginalis]|nr:PBECR4 domain-containing protein [uncultured Sneathia sp.]